MSNQSEPIDFWFSIGSLYSFLSVMRLPQIEAETGARFRWRPFLVGVIMREMDNLPAAKPQKLAYLMRDVERRAALYGFPLPVLPTYPLKNYVLANKIAIVGVREGWCENYVRGAYRRWFLGAGDEPNVSDTLHEIGQDPDRVIALAQSDEISQTLRTVTDEARALGIFGVPTFVTRGEMFWGDDRLDDAVRWSKDGLLGG